MTWFLRHRYTYATGACAMCFPAYASEFYELSESERLQLVAEAVRLHSSLLPSHEGVLEA